MAVQPKASRISPKQRIADKANLAKARAAQRRSGALHHHTAKQKAASRANLAKGRAAQKARRAGKTPVSRKKPAALRPDILNLAGSPGKPTPQLRSAGLPVSLHELPACGPVALAEHLAIFTGIRLPDEAVLAVHNQAGVVSLADLLERMAAEGLAGPGTRLAYYERCDPGTLVPGLLYGVQLSSGYHAVIAHAGGMLSWGQLLPWQGVPEESWWLEWEAE